MFELFRSVLPNGGQHKGTSPCKAPGGCFRSTREGKPFCSTHVELAPYVQKILKILAKKDDERKILDRGVGRIPTDSFFYRETLLLLRSKDFTAKGLARQLDLSHNASKRLIWLIAKDKLANCAATSRGDLTISGLGVQDLAAVEE